MPETRFGEMAGSGILKTGTTFSINPVQNLRFVTVTDRLTVPQDTSPDSAASVAYVQRTLSGSGRVGAGNGLTANNGILALDKRQTFHQVTITKKPEALTDAATVAYVNEALSDRPSKSFVDFALEDIRESYVRQEYVEDALADLASRSTVSQLISESEAVTKAHIAEATSGFATTSDVNTVREATQDLVSQQHLDETFAHVTEELAEVQRQVAGKASIADVEATDSLLVSKEYFEQYAKNTATRGYVDGKVAELVNRAEFDKVIAEVAPRDYVDSSVAGLATTEYVESALVSAASGTGGVISDIQYVVPISEETIKIHDCSYLILNPVSALESLILSFPTENLKQKVLVILTSRDINNLKFAGLITAGDVAVPNSITLTAGQSLRFLYVAKAQAWFIA